MDSSQGVGACISRCNGDVGFKKFIISVDASSTVYLNRLDRLAASIFLQSTSRFRYGSFSTVSKTNEVKDERIGLSSFFALVAVSFALSQKCLILSSAAGSK
jgi:hypothetical protein